MGRFINREINELIAANSPNTDISVASVILDQLSRAPEGSTEGMGRLKLMLGASNFVKVWNHGVRFRFKGCREFNCCQIKLNAADTYDMIFYRISRSTARLHEVNDVHADELSTTFRDVTGLDTHL